MALALVRYKFFGRRTANFLIVIPMATPEVVMGAVAPVVLPDPEHARRSGSRPC